MSAVNSSRRDFIKKAAAGLGAASFPIRSALGEGGGNRKNILFLFSDDQRFDALGAMGNTEIKTPHLDRLAKEGSLFTHAHIMGSTVPAVCMPSRAMLLTGRSLFHLEESGRTIPPEHVLLPEHLMLNGYETFGTGKWHNGKQAFARSFSSGGSVFLGGMSDHLAVPVFDFDPSGEYPSGRRYTAKKFSSELFTDEFIGFLNRHDGAKPFFAYVSYTAPHDPRMAPKEFADLYPPDSIELPPNFLTQHPFDNGELLIRDEKLAPFPRTPEIIREHIAGYYAMISHLDAQVGRILSALEESGLADDTLIVFAGDNGLAVGRHGLLGKQNLYDHSVRVPLILKGPGIPSGARFDSLCYLSDLFPTLCDLISLNAPESVEGKSLVPILRGERGAVRDSAFSVYKTFQRMVRKDDWKLILYNVDGEKTAQLFNLKEDPWEMRNLAKEDASSVRVEAITERLGEWMEEVDDICSLDIPGWIRRP